MTGLPPLATLQTAAAYRPLAHARLDEALWHYLDQGDDGRDSAALAAVRLLPRPLARVAGGHTRCQLFGQWLEHPLLVAPLAYQRLFHAEGEVGTAMAAAALGGQQVLSSLASQTIAEVARAAGQAGGRPPWFQLYWQGAQQGDQRCDQQCTRQGARDATARLLDQALAAGCPVVVFTVDAPVKRATLSLPAGVRAVNLPDPQDANLPGKLEGETLPGERSEVFDGWMRQAPDWDDLAWLRQRCPVPLLVKGLLHEDDAARAVALGAEGVVVSSHGGRVLDGAALALPTLARIARRLRGDYQAAGGAACGPAPVLLYDSGIRCGRDAFVALAHGAQAVLVGRPILWGLSCRGSLGVAHVLRLLRDDLEMTMALTGCATLADIGPQVLAP